MLASLIRKLGDDVLLTHALSQSSVIDGASISAVIFLQILFGHGRAFYPGNGLLAKSIRPIIGRGEERSMSYQINLWRR